MIAIRTGFTALLMLVCSTFMLHAGTHHCAPDTTAFTHGETVEYKVYYSWKSMNMAAGTVLFSVKPAELAGKMYTHITAIGKTLKKFDPFYKVYDRYETYIDPKSLRSRRFIRDINEGGFKTYGMADFNWAKDEVSSVLKINDHPEKHKTQKIDACTYDVLAAVYYTRCIDYSSFEPGDTVMMDVFLDDKIYHIAIQYLGKEVIKTKWGSFRCAKARPHLVEGRIFDDNTEGMTIYVTDDGNRLPLLIESPISVGSIKAMVTDFEGLKHPLTSKI